MFYCIVYNLFYLNCCVILYIFSCNSHPLFIWHSNLTQSMCNISDQQVYALPRAKHNFAMLTHYQFFKMYLLFINNLNVNNVNIMIHKQNEFMDNVGLTEDNSLVKLYIF